MIACPHGMPSRASCVDCMLDGPVADIARRPATVAYRFTAQYAGRCIECREEIREGDELARLTDETIVHEECAP